MKKRKFGLALSLVLAAGTVLGACGKSDDKENASENKDAFKVAMVTDVGGVDDKSFNQSAWEGLQAFGKANGLEKGDGIDYLQSQSDADYATNLNSLVRQKNNLVFGIGFLMQAAVQEIAEQQTDAHFAIVDSVIDLPNVASITFKEQEASFLAGVAAGKATKSNKIGFIGGVEGEVVGRFEAGFVDGVKAANPKAKVDVQYAGAFDKPEIGKTIASKMYSSGADVVFHASGGTGAGLFTEARELKEKNPDKYIWAIGVDSDQSNEGVVGEHNIVLTSALKGVATAVQDVSNKAKDGKFPGGESLVYGLAEDGVGLSEVNKEVENKADIDAAVEEWTAKIKNGDYTVPDKPAK
ncbi:BMP family lipoprotein [Niallia nealsonii]|uniref:BMP family ABC transporter substrate-binding protein n=1 Tax=Niallia nealsonii TaxID=115979 RepID=A0A2N0Z0Q8_9BACI|nr:BMP family protein [Niallia nealsonii]PKG23089.1 BMP family ABC transporter substrate-binding protein [Niallia nealsonii]